jgi:bifunctional NMN adenylyltransferase/nudix hydrolase
MTKKYDAIVYIGRFEPFHNGHANTILHAATLAHHVIVLVGSAYEPRTFKNPFTFAEREEMIDAWMLNQKDIASRLTSIRPIENSPYSEEAWVKAVQDSVNEVLYDHFGPPMEGFFKPKVAIIGHKKDGSSYYLDMFPQWDFIEEPLVEPLDATSIRDIYFSDKCNFNWFEGVLPKEVIDYLKEFKTVKKYVYDHPTLGKIHTNHAPIEEPNPIYEQIVREREFLKKHAKQYEHLTYPPIFVTVDAVVLQAGHVLMVKRRAEPGRGLWALPGGYLNAKTDKNVEEGMLRELREETLIKVPEKVLRGCIEEVKVFDAVDRSERGRIITHAHKIVLKDFENGLPKVKGADDAEKAQWVPLADIVRENVFEDHWSIIQYFVGR